MLSIQQNLLKGKYPLGCQTPDMQMPDSRCRLLYLQALPSFNISFFKKTYVVGSFRLPTDRSRKVGLMLDCIQEPPGYRRKTRSLRLGASSHSVPLALDQFAPSKFLAVRNFSPTSTSFRRSAHRLCSFMDSTHSVH